MSIYETTIKNPKKIAEFYKQLSEQKDIEIKQLKSQLEQRDNIINKVREYVEEYKKQWTLDDEVLNDMNYLLEILNIDKGDE